MSGDKIQPGHRERQAYVYIRQSSQRQVEEHLESQKLQYQLVQRAQALGWRPEQVVVVDDDLGKSGASKVERHGFQALVAAVGLGQVGIILVTDVSRLARNCADWHQLLDLASVCDTLINDAGEVYDPAVFFRLQSVNTLPKKALAAKEKRLVNPDSSVHGDHTTNHNPLD